MAWVTSDPRIRQLRKAEAPMGWFPFPPAQGTAGLKFLSHPVTPAWLILSPATSKAQKSESQHNSQMLLWHFHHPQPHLRGEREGGRGGTQGQSVSGTGKAERGGEVKCNAFSGMPAAWGCSKLPPAASWNMVQISAQTAQLQRPWLDIKAASLLGQPSASLQADTDPEAMPPPLVQAQPLSQSSSPKFSHHHHHHPPEGQL